MTHLTIKQLAKRAAYKRAMDQAAKPAPAKGLKPVPSYMAPVSRYRGNQPKLPEPLSQNTILRNDNHQAMKGTPGPTGYLPTQFKQYPKTNFPHPEISDFLWPPSSPEPTKNHGAALPPKLRTKDMETATGVTPTVQYQLDDNTQAGYLNKYAPSYSARSMQDRLHSLDMPKSVSGKSLTREDVFKQLMLQANKPIPEVTSRLSANPEAYELLKRRHGGRVPRFSNPSGILGGITQYRGDPLGRVGAKAYYRNTDGRIFVDPRLPGLPSGYRTMGTAGVLNHEAEHKRQFAPFVGSDMNQAQQLTSEIGPTIGDIVFSGEVFRNREGKNPDVPVKFYGDGRKVHDLKWMMDQARSHGYFDGRSMHDLIFNTPEGRAWYKQNNRARPAGSSLE